MSAKMQTHHVEGASKTALECALEACNVKLIAIKHDADRMQNRARESLEERLRAILESLKVEIPKGAAVRPSRDGAAIDMLPPPEPPPEPPLGDRPPGPPPKKRAKKKASRKRR